MSSKTTKLESAKTPSPNPWLAVQCQLRARAKLARKWSIFVLFFLVAVVIFGVLGIYFANHITGDSTVGYTYPAPGSYNYDTNSSSGFNYASSDEHGSKKNKTRDSKTDADLDRLKSELSGLQSKIEKMEPQIEDAKSTVTDIKSRMDSVERDSKMLKNKMGTLEREVAKGSPRLEFLVTAFATRFGIAAVALLLVKILTSIYRYHARLAAHFDSKADALELSSPNDVAVLEKVCLAFSTAGVDFQESADSIAEHAVEIARKVVPGSHS